MFLSSALHVLAIFWKYDDQTVLHFGGVLFVLIFPSGRWKSRYWAEAGLGEALFKSDSCFWELIVE